MSKFVVQKDFVDEMLATLPEPVKVQVELSAEDLVEGSSNKNLWCVICKNIVNNDSEECAKCKKLYCKSCISRWLQSKPTCPNCKQEYTSEPVNLIVKSMLDDFKFKCRVCD